MDWTRDGRDWPNRAASRLIDCRPHRWHVQERGIGPTLLLLHGAGGATHSWRDMFPDLAQDFHVVAPDLPGHGFTRMGTRQRSGLDPMAEDLLRLCDTEGWRPAALIGHSAGAAIALRMAELMPDPPRAAIGINAALGGFDGVAGWLFPMLAKALALTPLPSVFARLPNAEGRVRRLLTSTGSRIDAEGERLYTRLLRDPAHVEGALGMMAQWRLEGLLARLPELRLPVLLIAGENDRTVSVQVTRNAARRIPGCEVLTLPGLGHLAHEERPETVTRACRAFLSGHID